jgi:signal transduction histidine kinase/DNA-binding response OmpR family regulator
MPLPLLRMEIRHEYDVVLVRQRARQIAAALSFDSQDQTRIATALSEIARNAFQYANGGVVDFAVEQGVAPALLVTISDKGRGIENLRQILDGKYVSRTGMGLGMIGARRLMDVFTVDSSSSGTKVTLGKNIPPRLSSLRKRDLDDLFRKIELQGPQNAYEELQQQNQELLRTLDELRARQMELAQLNRELDETNRGVVALYAELDDKADFLQRASELKSHFLSNMSHEFRTPLNSIIALSQILLDRMDGELSNEQDKQVRFIKNSAQDLTDLVNDLLDLAKVEAGKVTIRPSRFAVNNLFATLRGMLRPLLVQNSSVRLIFDDPEDDIHIYSDEGKLSQILRNFISNALKFTERGEVRVFVTRGSDQTIAFGVSDTGIGIAAEDQERIFEEWTQVEGKLQKVAKGTGLGLPLSRKLAQLLGGNVEVKSSPGVGSVFTVTIPVTFRDDGDTAYVPEEGDRDATRLPVLVIEDNREALFIYEQFLKGTQFQLVPASNVAEAQAALRQRRPHAIILDVLLQNENSWDLLRDLKTEPSTRDIPVFVVTVIDNREKALELGANGFHPKPVEREWILKRLERSFAARPILVIDDDSVSRYVIKGLLSDTQYEIAEASGGSEGLRAARDLKPALIVLDLVMNDLSGFEVLDQLQADPATRTIPVVIHTSKDLDRNEKSRLNAAIDIIPKSVVNSRELALATFTDAFRKAGLTLQPRMENQPVTAE